MNRIGLCHLVVGYDYAFGRRREGDIAFLRRKAGELGFTVEALAPIAGEGGAYSSTRIRQLLGEGEVGQVVGLLGRHYTVEGQVVRGAARGKTLGFPTANLACDKDLLPKPGVYAVKVRYGQKMLDGVVNIGCNPTFCNEALSVEVHLLDFDRQIYGETLRLYFIARLRDEKAFPSVEELKRAIAADVGRAREILRGSRVVEYREYLGRKGSNGQIEEQKP